MSDIILAISIWNLKEQKESKLRNLNLSVVHVYI